jgi:GTP-binding protein HflX
VGYTNSGKSTLLNCLSHAGVMAESMLFATLDPTTRKVKLPGFKTHPEVLLTDTVGFIQKLPTHLVAAFRATLEEVQEADVLIHVIDVSNPSWSKQENAVLSVLADIGAADKPIVRVLNKMDLLDDETAEFFRDQSTMTKHSVAVSALLGDGVSDMVACVEDALADMLFPIEVEIPYSKGEEMNMLHEQGNIQYIDYRETGTYVRAQVPRPVANRMQQYSILAALDANATPSPATLSAKQGKADIDWARIGRGRH